MNAGILHRGPDEDGYFEAEGIGLAMRRLSIVDCAGSHQPITNEDGTIHVVFNGEIYNYLELREHLERRGHHLATQGDTEVLVHLYEEMGVEMLSCLRGMFAIALWDARTRSLLLARDRLGKKPLCYAAVGDGLRFCSELAPLVEHANLGRDMDPLALGSFLISGYIPAPHSIYRGISKLPPGHYLHWQAGRIQVKRYWRLSFDRKLACSRSEALDRLRAKLDESISLRLRSDVPVGLLLSGGLDSNAILSRLVLGLGRRVTAFTVGFDEDRYDETDAARASARHFGIEHHVLPGRSEMLDLLPKLVRHYGEPYADKSALPSFLLCELTRTKVKVALNGDGGDEAFAGYEKYRKAAAAGPITNQFLPLPLRQRWTQAALVGRGVLAAKALRGLRRRLLPATASVLSSEFFGGGWFPVLTTRAYREQIGDQLAATASGFWDGAAEPVDRMLAWDYDHYLADDLLVKMDIASMAYGLEVRSPFLDHELVEFCAALPSDWKVDGFQGKLLLRELVERDLPVGLLQASKRGFSVPLDSWWRGPAQKQLHEALHNLHPALLAFINPECIKRLLEEHQQSRRSHAQRLWALWVLNVWAQQNLPA